MPNVFLVTVLKKNLLREARVDVNYEGPKFPFNRNVAVTFDHLRSTL